MKFFQIILVLLTITLSLTSCEKDLSNVKELEVKDLISLHENSIETVQRDVSINPDSKNELKRAFKRFPNDLYNKNMDDFWEEHEMTQIIEAVEYFLHNEADENVYSVLLSDFDLTTPEYEKMFLVAEVTKIVPDVIPEEFPNGIEARYSCAIAVGGYVVTVFSAVTIGGPVGLAFWAAGIGFGAAGIVDSCG